MIITVVTEHCSVTASQIFSMKHRKPNRLRNYDYSQNGMYFVTICTKGKKCFFGKVVNSKMELNIIGKITRKYLIDIPKHRTEVTIDEFIIMPNHIHLIVELIDTVVTEQCYVTTSNDENIGLLSKIIQSYKGVVTKEINELYPNNNFQWQRSFYDHVIRQHESLNKIREYIMINPQEWNKDKLNPKIKL